MPLTKENNNVLRACNYSKETGKGNKEHQTMGMSASQVRFLSLQHRKHNIGNQLNLLSNKKMALSRDMNKVAKDYTNKLNQSRLKWTNDSGYNYNDLSYNLLMKPNDLNCEKPYIITDKNGRVVLDNKKIFYDEDKGEFVLGSAAVSAASAVGKEAISYQEIGALVSSYSGLTPDGEVTYNNLNNVDGPVTITDTSVETTALSGGKSLGEDKYEISVGEQVYNYDSSLRFDIMERLGLITSSVKQRFTDTLNALYGNKAGANFPGGMEALLKNFDKNHEFKLTEGEGDDYREYGYDVYFGSLEYDKNDFSFKLNGGCAMGNLALAKAYQKEYQAYLNTPIVHDLHVKGEALDANDDKNPYRQDDLFYVNAEHLSAYTGDENHPSVSGTDSEGQKYGISESYDLSHTVSNPRYTYIEEEKTGISSRMANLLYEAEDSDLEVSFDEYGNAKLKVKEVLKYLNFWNTSEADSTALASFDNLHDYSSHDKEGSEKVNSGSWYWTEICAEYDDEGYVYGEDGHEGTLFGKYDGDGGWSNLGTGYANANTLNQVTNWSYLYDNTIYGGWNAYNGTGLAHNQKYADSGVTLRTREYSGNHDQSLQESHAMLNLSDIGCFVSGDITTNTEYGLLESLRDSFLHYPGIDEGGVNYAYIMTKYLYSDGINDYTDDGPNYFQADDCREAATNNSWNRYGTTWSDKVGWASPSGDVTTVNTTHLINAFATFYEMYVAVDGDVGNLVHETYTDCDDYSAFNTYYFDNTGRVVNTSKMENGAKAYIPALQQSMNNYFDSTISEALITSHGNKVDDAMHALYNEWKGSNTVTPDATNPNIVSYTESDGTIKSATITYNAGGQITGIVFKNSDKDDDGAYHEYIDRAVTTDYSNQKITVNNYDFYYDADGNIIESSGQRNSAIVTYISTGNATIELQSGFQVNGGTLWIEEDTDCPVGGCDDDDRHSHNRGIAYSMTIGKDNGQYVITGVNGTADNGLWQEAPNKYVIVTEKGGSVIDTNYYYNIDATFPVNGANTTTITTKPVDNYGEKLKKLVADCQERVDDLNQDLEQCFAGISPKLMEYLDGLFKRISENGWVCDKKVNSDNAAMSQKYLEAMLDNNEYFITEYNSATNSGSYDYVTKQATNITKIYKVHDDNLENVALSEYEAAKTLISNKERIIDTRMQMLETEQEAINTELQSIKKVRNENIEKTFKIFA